MNKHPHMKKYILFIATVLLGCDGNEAGKTEPNVVTVDYLVFGWYHGECGGERCKEIFKLTENKVYEDKSDSYPLQIDESYAAFEELSDQLFDEVKELRTQFPAALLRIEDTVIGQPDAYDQGGLYIEVSINGEKKYWNTDKAGSSSTEAFDSFLVKVESAINSLE